MCPIFGLLLLWPLPRFVRIMLIGRSLHFFLLMCLSAITGVSCTNPQSEFGSAPGLDEKIVITDALGRQVTLPGSAENVVTIAPGATHVVRSAGGIDKLAAVTTADYQDADLAHLPRISALPLDLEGIVALDPDLILASDQVNDPAHAEMFEALGIPIVYLGSTSWVDIKDSVVLTGRMLDSREIAESSVDSLEASRSALLAITNRLTDRPTGVFLVSHITSYSFGKGSYVLDLMRWAGMEPLTQEFDSPAPILDDEWVLLKNPDFMLGSFGESDTPAGLTEHHPTWQNLDAIKDGRIVDVPVRTILTPGPENVRAAWHMARAVHPALFDTLSMTVMPESQTP